MGAYGVPSAGAGYVQGYGMMGGFGASMAYGYGWIFSGILWVLAVVALVLAIVWLYRNVQNKGNGKKPRR
ncbi:MAG: hypothetical protein V1728_04505 [Candidatus Micrarchaeota archaeon]